MTILSTWEVAINPVFGIRFAEEPLCSLQTDILELLEQTWLRIGGKRILGLFDSHEWRMGMIRPHIANVKNRPKPSSIRGNRRLLLFNSLPVNLPRFTEIQ